MPAEMRQLCPECNGAMYWSNVTVHPAVVSALDALTLALAEQDGYHRGARFAQREVTYDDPDYRQTWRLAVVGENGRAIRLPQAPDQVGDMLRRQSEVMEYLAARVRSAFGRLGMAVDRWHNVTRDHGGLDDAG